MNHHTLKFEHLLNSKCTIRTIEKIETNKTSPWGRISIMMEIIQEQHHLQMLIHVKPVDNYLQFDAPTDQLTFQTFLPSTV